MIPSTAFDICFARKRDEREITAFSGRM